MMNKKRSASAAEAASPGSKKRKTDQMQKFYAVRVGFRPGVYLTYAECSKQTAGFKGAIFKSFTAREDAEAFVAGLKVAADPNEPERFYAVAVGSPTGIFSDWSEAALAIKGVKGPKYKRFESRAEAVAYIWQYGNRKAVETLGEPLENKTVTPTDVISKPTRNGLPTGQPTEDVLHIYTDGSSLANGKKGSRAGVGVFFGDGDVRNLSQRLEGEPQTNQRAELTAMLRALEIAPLHQTVCIFSDSQYSINCVTQWTAGWQKKKWVTATGDMVKNQDLIRAVLAKMEERTIMGANTYFHWVKGHATSRGNVAVDRLAVMGAKIGVA